MTKEVKSNYQESGDLTTKGHFFVIGEKYLIRTVTMIQVGVLTGVSDDELLLENAAWVADTGRFNKALETGELSDVEPFPDGVTIVGRGAIVDAPKWKHALLREVLPKGS